MAVLSRHQASFRLASLARGARRRLYHTGSIGTNVSGRVWQPLP